MSTAPLTPGPNALSLSEWLGAIGLSRLEPLLRDNGIAEDVLTSLTEADLEKLGMSMGDRKRMMRAIGDLVTAASTPALHPNHGDTVQSVLAAEAQAAKEPATQSPELRQLTIMFCDLVDATALCARLSPEQWRQVVLAYQQASVAVISRCGGTVAQYLGDGLLVYFGYPQAQEDAAVRAVHAGLDLVRNVTALEINVEGAEGPEQVRLQVRIGIDTGRVVIGDIGAGPRREQLALGDTPNIAARLQALARANTVLISDQTRRLTAGAFLYDDQGVHSLKGVKGQRQVWQVTGLSEMASRFDATSGGEQLSPLVGRVQEMSLLTERWQTVLQGQGQVVLLSGEPGIGKSRMLKELCDRLGNAGLNALQLQCVAHKVNSAFHPFIDCMERTLRLKPEMSVASKLDRIDEFVRARLAGSPQRAALLAAMLSLPSDGRHELAVTSAYQREQDFIELVLSLLEDRASHQPSLVIFEDAHWADPASVGALNKIAERTRHLPLLLVVTHRPEFVPAFERQAHVTALKVPGLRRAEVLALVTRLMGDAALPSALTQQIEDRTDGVPLFVEELTKTLMEGVVVAGAGMQAALPATLRDSLMARLDRHARAKEIAQIGSVIGREFGHELLAALVPAQQGATMLDDGIQDLLRSGLAMRQETEQGAVYVFKHALVQDTAYDSLPKDRREGLHGAIVDALEARYPDTAVQQPALLARHASAAGQGRRAIPYWRRASEQALSRLALHEAAAHLQSGLEVLTKLIPGTDRDQSELQLRASLGTVHMLGKGWAAPEVAQAYQRANELASAADKVDEAIWPLWGVCVYHQVHGEITQAQAIGRRMTTVARQSNSRHAWLVNNMMQLQLCFYSGRLPEVPGLCEQVEHGFNDPQDRSLIALYSTDLKLVAMVHGLHAQWIMGQVDDVDRACDAIEQRALALNHPYSLAWARTWGMMSRLHAGHADLVQVARLLPKLEAGLQIAQEHGFAYVSAMARFAMGWCQTRMGEREAGIALMDEGLKAFQDTGAGIVLPFFLALMAEALGQAGRVDEAGECLAQAWLRIGKGGERWHEAELHRIRGALLARAPQPDILQARACYGQAMAVAQAQQALVWYQRAAAALAALDD